MIQIRPVSDLRNKFSDIEKAVGEGEPVNEETVNMHLGNEMADVIAQVIRLADVYHIDLEKAYIESREDEARYLDSRGV